MVEARGGFFSYTRGKQWAVCLLAVWFLLNILDIITTYQAIATGRAAEVNPIMALLIGAPLLLISVKLLLALAAGKIVEKMESRGSYYAVLSLLVLNVYVTLVCTNNIRVVLNL